MQLKKALLASAIAALSSSAFAMQAMDDESLSATTGQDGLTISVIPPAAGLTLNMAWHDLDGFTGATSAGAVFVGEPDGAGTLLPFRLVTGTSGMRIDIDASGDVSAAATGSQAGLRVRTTFTEAATISTGDISVAATTAAYATSAQTAKILNSMDITLGAGTTADLYLGNELDGKGMINLASTITGGITIGAIGTATGDFVLTDADSGGTITADRIVIDSAGATTDLSLDINIDATTSGLSVNMGATTATGSFDITLVDLKLGSNVSMGDIQIKGLDLVGTTIRIAGH